jgi:hypothetical protein
MKEETNKPSHFSRDVYVIRCNMPLISEKESIGMQYGFIFIKYQNSFIVDDDH